MPNSTLETRRDQMFPVLEANEVERLRPFGTLATYADGDSLFRAGEIGLGMFIILKGQVVVTRKATVGREQPIVVEGAGAFLAELAQLSGSSRQALGGVKRPLAHAGLTKSCLEAPLPEPERHWLSVAKRQSTACSPSFRQGYLCGNRFRRAARAEIHGLGILRDAPEQASLSRAPRG
jgi:CRP-like cAMP-binding protein